MHLIADENKKRLWKLLCKFFTEKQLLNANLQELYDYIDKGFTNADFQDRSTPPLPSRDQPLIFCIPSFANCLKNLKPPHRPRNLPKAIHYHVFLLWLRQICPCPLSIKLLTPKGNPQLLKMALIQSLSKKKSPRTVLLQMPLSEPSSVLLHSCYSSPF